MSNLTSKILTILVALVLFFGVGVYPILATRYRLPAPQWLLDRQLKLGLDLKGGVHLVLRVQTEDALKVTTEQESGRLQEELKRRGVPATVVPVDATTFRVDGVPPAQDQAFRQAAEQEGVNFERSTGTNGSYTFRMRPNIAQTLREEAVVQARQTIERRVNELGVTEPSIAQQGFDQILVQLPGVTDVDRAKEIIGSPGMLELKLVEQGPAANRDDLLRSTGGVVPADMEILSGNGSATDGGTGTLYYLVRRVAAVTGQNLRSARVQLDENNQPAVGFTLNPQGAATFAKVTGENIGRFLAIVLDKTVQSAPSINGRIAGDGQIAGGFTQEEAQDLALILRSGALPATLTYLEERTIGPTLGADSIRSGVLASLVGLLLISTFMLIYYKLSGVNAIVALLFNLVILLGLMAYVGAVMTLPGIAGFVLTMGMGVDSNVLIFERIKEELQAQRGVRAAINAGFGRVFWTLVDTHTAALISAAFLFQFGTGPIRGFAVALVFGLVSNLFTSIFVSKTLFEIVLANRKVASLSI
ncbi:MAG TPA: protein translocase subunit SecD [Vicinamibacterales bacterium]|nr:protein translocase subunit SecD [Vicinamibacterales bacterium]